MEHGYGAMTTLAHWEVGTWGHRDIGARGHRDMWTLEDWRI